MWPFKKNTKNTTTNFKTAKNEEPKIIERNITDKILNPVAFNENGILKERNSGGWLDIVNPVQEDFNKLISKGSSAEFLENLYNFGIDTKYFYPNIYFCTLFDRLIKLPSKAKDKVRDLIKIISTDDSVICIFCDKNLNFKTFSSNSELADYFINKLNIQKINRTSVVQAIIKKFSKLPNGAEMQSRLLNSSELSKCFLPLSEIKNILIDAINKNNFQKALKIIDALNNKNFNNHYTQEELDKELFFWIKLCNSGGKIYKADDYLYALEAVESPTGIANILESYYEDIDYILEQPKIDWYKDEELSEFDYEDDEEIDEDNDEDELDKDPDDEDDCDFYDYGPYD